jgi:hypothetical protein
MQRTVIRATAEPHRQAWESSMNKKNIVIGPPVKGQWAIMNPPGHPKLGYDFLAVDDRKNPYKRGYFLNGDHLRLQVND